MAQDMTENNLTPKANVSVVTRFAPSPTGYLHIGGARTALFNALYAQHMGGRFLLRIEDTDKARSTEDAVKAIFDGLNWLDLKSDAAVVYQSRNEARHREVVQALLERGAAYRCYMTAQETEVAREDARLAGHALRSPWRNRSTREYPDDQPYVIRFKGPISQPLIIEDAVQGRVQFDTKDLDDLILARSDGTPTYNLAVVVDDHDMAVTHIIRGDDHLNNAARQSLIYQAMGWDIPVFAHIPLIHGPDGAKLSKRHGAQAVGDYSDLGYIPEAMCNYLSRLGWSHGDDELFSRQDAIQWFDIKDINKAPARLDFAKLDHVNAHWIKTINIDRLVKLTLTFIADMYRSESDIEARLTSILPLVRERAKTLIELAKSVEFAFIRTLPELDDKARAQLDTESRSRLERFLVRIQSQTDWSIESLDQTLKAFIESEAIGFGNFGPILRLALSAGKPAPDMARTLSALGIKETVRRINHTLFI